MLKCELFTFDDRWQLASKNFCEPAEELMVLTVQNLLTSEQIATVANILRSARFIDGRATAHVAHDKKYNRELEVGEEYLALVELVERALRGNSEVERKLFPRFITRPIISRYETGMFYKEHIDKPIQGMHTQFGPSMAPFGQGFIRTDFSMTLFLEDPSKYTGGELEVRVEGEKRQYKLQAGSAVFYRTGSLHSVRPVTQGVRTAAVVWIQSMVHSEDNRKLLLEAHDLCERIYKALPDSEESFCAIDHYSNLIRHFADV
jgi:PKHD-type hydroxylase